MCKNEYDAHRHMKQDRVVINPSIKTSMAAKYNKLRKYMPRWLARFIVYRT